MRLNLTRTIVAALALAIAPAAAQAQQPGGLDPSQLPPEVQQAIMELQQIQAQLQPIQQQAMADPAIQAEQQELGTQIQTAMAEADPEVPQHMARLQELAGDAEQALERSTGPTKVRFRSVISASQEGHGDWVPFATLLEHPDATREELQDALLEKYFRSHPLGYRVLGTNESMPIRSTTSIV